MNKPLSFIILLIFIGLALAVDGMLWWHMRPHLPDKSPALARSNSSTLRKSLLAQTKALQQQITTSSSDDVAITVAHYDLVHNALQTTTSAQGNITSDVIIIGTHYYVRDMTDNKWWAQTIPHPTDAQQALGSVAAYTKMLHDSTMYDGFLPAASESCGSDECSAFKKDSQGTTTTLLVGKDNLVRKKTAVAGGITITMQFAYAPLTITPPAQTKPVPPGENIFEKAFKDTSGINATATPEERQELQELNQQLSG